jgi:lycopene cyclase domain-containing protein
MWDHIMRYVYLHLDLATLLGPLALSFDRRVAFHKLWRPLFTSMIFASGIYLIWDVLFTRWGVWSFNPDYLVGYSPFGLPVEEWLFFVVVPYATVFIYECYRCYPLPRMADMWVTGLTYLLVGFLLVMAFVHLDKRYTSWTSFATIGALVLHVNLHGWRHLGNAYLGWVICLVPFLLVNGVLTALPVVSYNDAENLGLRLGTIPVEDVFYGFTLYLLTLTGLEWGRREKSTI